MLRTHPLVLALPKYAFEGTLSECGVLFVNFSFIFGAETPRIYNFLLERSCLK